MNNRVRTILVVAVAMVWAVNMSAPIWVKGYVPPTSVHIIFMAVLGVLTSSYNRNGNSNETEDRQPPRKRSSPRREVDSDSGENDNNGQQDDRRRSPR